MDFRYAQFCPLTRAVEILGERWTILVVRELFLGPKRFSDLRAALRGVSPSVLAERLARLEERGIVRRRELPPPAASAVYELDEAGRALRPLLIEMTRWGMRFLGSPDPSDAFRPEWLLLGLQVFARTDSTPGVSARLHVHGESESVDLYVAGSDAGTTVSRTPSATDCTITAPPMEMLMFASGLVVPGEADTPAALRVTGDLDAARRIASLFDFRPTPDTPDVVPAVSIPAQEHAPRTGAAKGRKPAARSGKPAAADRSRQGATRP